MWQEISRCVFGICICPCICVYVYLLLCILHCIAHPFSGNQGVCLPGSVAGETPRGSKPWPLPRFQSSTLFWSVKSTLWFLPSLENLQNFAPFPVLVVFFFSPLLKKLGVRLKALIFTINPGSGHLKHNLLIMSSFKLKNAKL